MIRSLWSALFLCFALTLAHGQKKQWTLPECIAYAYENNLSIKQNLLNVESTELQKDASMANLFPNLNFSGGYFWQFGFSIDPITNTRRPGNRQTSSMTLSSNWILFDGMQNYNRISQSRINHMAALYNLEAMKNDISINIASAYLQILLNKQVVEITENQLKISESQALRTKRLYESGSLAKGDFLQSEAQRARDEQSVIAARNNLDISLLQLAQILQIENVSDFDIVTPKLSEEIGNLLNYSAKEIYDIAMGNQPSIKSAELSVQSAQKGLSIARGGYSPIISLQAQVNSNASQDFQRVKDFYYGYVPIGSLVPGSTDINDAVWSVNQQTIPLSYETYPFFQQFNNNINQFVGLNIQVPIFNRYQTRNNIRSNEIQYVQTQLQLETQKNNLRQTIERAYADAMASLKSFHAAERSLEASKESWEYAQKRFEQGAMNQFDYENTRNQYLNTLAQMLQSKYDYIFKAKVLEFYLTNNITL